MRYMWTPITQHSDEQAMRRATGRHSAEECARNGQNQAQVKNTMNARSANSAISQ